MKKKTVFAILIALTLLIFPLVSAVQTDMKNELKQGETLIAKISGNFIEPVKEDGIYFYRGYTQVPFEFELTKIKGKYYISASTKDKSPGNYSLTIKNTEYYIEGGQTSDEEIVANFSISYKYADFSVNPGVQISPEGGFSLEIQNLKDDEITVSISEGEFSWSSSQTSSQTTSTQQQENETGKVGFFDFLFGKGNETNENESSGMTGQVILVSEENNLNSQITLKAGESKKIDFEFRDVPDETLKTIKLISGEFSQEVLVYILSSQKTQRQATSNLFFEQNFFDILMPTTSNTTRILYLKNNGETTFENVTFEISDSLKEYTSLEPSIIEDFENNKTKKINLTISSKNESKTIAGLIKAKTSDGLYAYLDISLQIIPGYLPTNQTSNNTNNETPSIFIPCIQLGGKVCESGKECNTTVEPSSDGACCLSACVDKKKSPAGRIIAIVILALLIIAYVWFYFKRYRKTKRKVDVLEVAEGKKKKL